MVEQLTADDFSGLIGQQLAVRIDEAGTEVPLELTAVTALPALAPELRAPFSLEFSGPTEPLLSQRIYELVHPTLGPLALFIVPLGLSADAARYEIAFG